MANQPKFRTITCEGCQKVISGRFEKTKRFCSKQCFSNTRKNGRCKACEQCGKRFYIPKSQENTRFCSVECFHTHGKDPMPHTKNGKDKICEWCGQKFYVPKVRLAARFCSSNCLNDWQGRNKITLTCKTCDNSYRVSPSRIKFDNPTYCSLECRDNDPDRKAMLLDMNVRQQSLKPNKLEKLGYSILDNLGISYYRQYVIANKFCVDAFIPSKNTIIQFDGDYWHGHPVKFPNPDKRQLKRMALDKSQDAYMKKCGYTIIRVWEAELKHSPETVQRQLARALLT